MKKDDEKRYLRMTITGDEAVRMNVLDSSLRISGSKKAEKDINLVNLGMLCLERVIEDCKIKTGKPYPSEQDIINHLSKKGGQLIMNV